jgi:hypothetical protein
MLILNENDIVHFISSFLLYCNFHAICRSAKYPALGHDAKSFSIIWLLDSAKRMGMGVLGGIWPLTVASVAIGGAITTIAGVVVSIARSRVMVAVT